MAKVTKRCRDAKTGEFVTKEYTQKHPSTTVTETVKPGKQKPNKGK